MKSYILLAICILMLVARVLPHHHHSEIFCLSEDLVAHQVTPECKGDMHHSDDADRHTCTSACVTNFQFGTPDHHGSDVTPDYSFYTILYSLVAILHLPLCPVSDADTERALYAESLHARNCVQTAGLRAPPASC